MKRQDFNQLAKSEILIMDGAMGTMITPHLPQGSCQDFASLTSPDLVANLHRRYAEAGADIILTNTFGANRIKLKEYGLAEKVKEINQAGVNLAKKAAKNHILLAGSIGPTGKLIEPLGELSFEETYENYKEQALLLSQEGVDLLVLETFGDLKEAKIALMAVRLHTDLPIMISLTYKEDFLTFTGTDPVTSASVLSSLGADAIGVNCSTGPEPMLEVLGRLVLATDKPVFLEPNATIYGLTGEGNVSDVSPEEMARFGEKFAEIGASIIGTCCGSTPEHTRLMKEKLMEKKPINRTIKPEMRLSSRYKTVIIGPDRPFAVIGERINPTNRTELSDEIQKDQINILQEEARLQESQGAHVLDVNIGVPGLDEEPLMSRVVRGIETVSRLPLSIDSTNPAAVETALKEYAGKALINSVTGESKSLKSMLPLAARYGSALVCLAVDDEGIPQKAGDRLKILKKIISGAEKAGIPRENLICDCVTLTVSAQQKRAQETLQSIRMVKDELKLPSILGVSNISYGLPERSLINATFLSMAMSAGLDAAIMNPGDGRMMDTVKAASVLTLRDSDSQEYVKTHIRKKKKKKKSETGPALLIKDEEKHIYQAILSGDKLGIDQLIEKAIALGLPAPGINDRILIPAIEEVGNRYDRKELYLPQMLLSAETFQAAFKTLEPYFNTSEIQSKGTVLLCTVKGDVHDIGKNIVGLFLKNHGFNVVDLGKNLSPREILKKASEYQADVVGLSALMTTTMTEMPKVVELFDKEGLSTKIIVGGAVVTQKYARGIGAHGYAKDGKSAVETIKIMISG